ncbi:MAG: hydroxymethylglutaryl-CoA lyase [Phycisphaerales bacterium]|nr:hydroxymethylglutaryl-CoA lyase [Phycisphaerales bacterium]
MSSTERVRVCEVAPRDGLQIERNFIATEDKIKFVNALTAAGFLEIEVTSFVSPRWVPQLADAKEVYSGIARGKGVVYSALVANERGLTAALECKVDKVAVFLSASESFSKRNINATIAESLVRVEPVIKQARAAGLPVRGYVSCSVRCPYEGAIEPSRVVRVAAELLELGVTDLDLADTIGAAVPKDIEMLLAATSSIVAVVDTTLHLHDTKGQALACARMALRLGVRRFDAAAGGLGGCPYAEGAPGNLASESLLQLAEDEGFASGVDRSKVIEAGAAMRRCIAARSSA